MKQFPKPLRFPLSPPQCLPPLWIPLYHYYSIVLHTESYVYYWNMDNGRESSISLSRYSKRFHGELNLIWKQRCILHCIFTSGYDRLHYTITTHALNEKLQNKINRKKNKNLQHEFTKMLLDMIISVTQLPYVLLNEKSQNKTKSTIGRTQRKFKIPWSWIACC